ncbi:MAG: hypothetical protein K0S41_2051 [Anaerocolumna sp.]|jgi:hypothetical protein|nr:hypothetical protein [Anaerocolumna sp.]
MKNIKIRYEVTPFCCEGSIMEDVLDTLGYISKQNDGDYSSVAVICQEELAEAILKHMCTLFAVNELDLHIDYIDFDKADYDDAYGVVLVIEGGELHISIEKATGNDKYKTFEMDYLYVSSDVDKEFVREQLAYETEIDIFKVLNDCE